jgi:hypothetical protein
MKTILKKLRALRADHITDGCDKRSGIFSLMILQVFLYSVLNAQTPSDANLIIQSGQGEMLVHLPDTTTITHLEVELGTANASSDLFHYVFTYDQSTGLPMGLHYQRSGAEVTLGLGIIDAADPYFARVRLKHSGLWSDWFSFLAN